MAQVRYFIVQAFVASCLLAILFKHTAAQADITVDDSEDTDPWQDSVVRNLSLSDTTPLPAETIWNVQNIVDTQQSDDQQNVQLKYPRIDKDSDEEQTTQTTTDNNGDDSDEEQTTTLQPETTTTEKTTITKITTDAFCIGFKPHTDNGFYLQFNGFGWLKKPCPYGLGFDQATCACSIKFLSHKSTTTTIPEAITNDDDDDDDDSDEEEQTTMTAAETTTTASTPEDDSNEEQTVTTTTEAPTTPETVSTTGDGSDEEETTTSEATTTIIETTAEEEDDDSKDEDTTTPEANTSTSETTSEEDDDSKDDDTTTPEANTSTSETTTKEEDDDSKDEDTTTPEANTSTSETTSEEDDESSEEETTTHEASTSTSETTSEDDNSDEDETTTMTTTEATVTTQAETTTVTPSLELCKECVIVHAVGYAPYPGNCESFIQCRYAGDVPTAIIVKRCPAGLQWNQNKLTCDSLDNVKCVTVNKCPNQKSTDDDDNSAYFIFNGNDWTRVPCPSGTGYNKATCGCTDRKGGDDDHHGNIQENCDDKKAISGDKAGYLQLTAIGWIRMPCPATVGYNEKTCRCTDTLITEIPTSRCPDKKSIPDNKSAFLQFTGFSWIRMPCPATLVYDSEKCICTFGVNDDDKSDSKDDDVCKSTITLNFENDDAIDTSHNGFWVNNTGVTFNDGKAYFNGKARLIIPGLANQDFGSTVYILIKYRHTSTSSQQTLVANGDCRVRQSIAVCSGKDSVDFYAETKEELLPAKVTVPNDTKLWRYAVYAFDNDKLQGKVGTNQAEQPIKGNIDRRHSGLIIGGGGSCDNFHGIIDELHVFQCKPSF